jgi:hypothetical protein
VQEQEAREQMIREQIAMQQLQVMRLRYWEILFLTTIEMSEPELRAALRHRSGDRRFAAAYVVGERLLEWPEDLIPRLEDNSPWVRQAARRSLIILSFLALNPEEARKIRARQRTEPAKPLAELNQPVDFGPAPTANRVAQARAARQWREWWAEQESRRPRKGSELVADARPVTHSAEGGRLAGKLLRTASEDRPGVVATYRDNKGVEYSEALAIAAARESGEARGQLREALAARMARMKDKSLLSYLQDEDPELRRAAVLGLALRKRASCMPQVIGVLLDPDPSVERAAHAALCSLSGGQDFGPAMHAPEQERQDAVARWRAWWEKQEAAP